MKSVAVLAAVLAATLAFAQPAPLRADPAADIFAGFQAKSDDPVSIKADVLEVFEEGKQRISQFIGNVTVTRGNTLLKAGAIKLYSNLDSKAADSFTRIEASGKIYVSSGDQTVTGSTAIVNMVSNTITVSGGVVLSQGANVISGNRLVVNLATGRARVEQEPGKQIRGVFSTGGASAGQ